MDKNRKEGTRHQVTGAIKEGTGKVTGDRSKQAEGNIEKNVGKVQRKIGEASDDSRHTDRDRH